jgi:hypothetical protein
LGASGRWQKILPGIYLAATGTVTIEQRQMAALLYAGPGAVLTGAAAVRRHANSADEAYALRHVRALVS